MANDSPASSPPPMPAWYFYLVTAVRDVGFPIVITVYLLYSMVPMMRELRDLGNETNWMIHQHTGIPYRITEYPGKGN